MAASKPSSRAPKAAEQQSDPVQAEVQRRFDEQTAKGYVGTVPDEHPNEAYSLASGPDSPVVTDDPNARVAQATVPTEET